jgi:hypothetical protein
MADGIGAREHHDMNTQYRRWTIEEDAAVIAMRQLDMTSREIGRMINRSCEAVRSRLFYSLPKREKTRPESTIQTKAVPQTEVVDLYVAGWRYAGRSAEGLCVMVKHEPGISRVNHGAPHPTQLGMT